MGTPDEPGIIPQAIADVFSLIDADDSRTYLLRISYLEIYNETLKDLLAPAALNGTDTALKIREASASKGSSARIYVDPLREEVVTRSAEVFEALDRGETSRHVGTTDWNARSSRSHCVFTLVSGVYRSQFLTKSLAQTIESSARTTTGSKSGVTRVSQLVRKSCEVLVPSADIIALPRT